MKQPKYSAKAEKRSEKLAEAYASVMKRYSDRNDDDSASGALRSLMMRTVVSGSAFGSECLQAGNATIDLNFCRKLVYVITKPLYYNTKIIVQNRSENFNRVVSSMFEQCPKC